MLAFLGIIIAVGLSVRFLSPRWLARSNATMGPNLPHRVTVRLTDAGLQYITDFSQHDYRWCVVNAIEPSVAGILLECCNKPILVPKYAFTSQQQMEEFKTQAGRYLQVSQGRSDSRIPFRKQRGLLLAEVFCILVGLLIILYSIWPRLPQDTRDGGWFGRQLTVRTASGRHALEAWLPVPKQGDSATAYEVATDGFKNRYSEEEFRASLESHIERMGQYKGWTSWANSYSCISVGPSSKPRRRALLGLKFYGSKSTMYVLCHMEQVNGRWAMDGCDVATASVRTDRFSEGIGDAPNRDFSVSFHLDAAIQTGDEN